MALKSGPHTNSTLRIGFLGHQPIGDYEPTSIRFAYEYMLLENIFSPLIEFDREGRLNPGVAESYRWVDNSLYLSIREMRTENGTAITADDVVFSLKRLLILSQNTHGNFRDVICPDQALKSVSDYCPGIQALGREVILTPAGGGKMKSFLLPMLAAIDFAILPKSSVDLVTLKIRDYRQTTGVYFVDSDDGLGHTVLKLNSAHYHAGADIAQSVVLIPIEKGGPNGAVESFARGEVDHLMTSNGAKIEDILKFAKSHDYVNLHATSQIRRQLLVFTERGLSELTLSQRRWIGKVVRDTVLTQASGVEGYEPANQFFPATGDGSLTVAELKELDRSPAASVSLPDIRIGVLRPIDLENWGASIHASLPGATVNLEREIPDLYDYKAKGEIEPHAFIVSVDTAFQEDIGLLSYWLNTGLLGLKKSERKEWLAKYMATVEQKDRLHQLHRLHMNVLKDAVAIPLLSSSFIAVSRKPWKMELSNLFANNQLWLVKQQ